ncbi:PilN domain-containing protein [Acuticoccus yangtzensis]|uniref:PilN domain-containing protein n=1 Tax=Acuticoccus yangtzensis TaxID=1443441 RepID=UPI0009497337|nr:PilN domain-containing protein [Acuticoccus yangtzensis]
MVSLTGRLVDAFAEVIAPLAVRGGGVRLVARETAEGYALVRVKGGRAVPVTAAEAKGHRGTVEVRLAPDKVLTRTVSLPAEGREFAEALLRHRLDRLTPWDPSQVVFGYAAAGAPGADRQMEVAFAATSAATAAAADRAMADLGLTVTALGVDDGAPEAPLLIDLHGGARAPSHAGLRRAVAVYSALALVLTGAAAVTTEVLRGAEETALATVERDLAGLRRALVARTASGGGDRAAGLLAAAGETWSVTVLIDALAERLPDATYLTALQIEPDSLHLAGLTNDAPGLVALLDGLGGADGTTGLTDVRFGAPVVRTDSGADRFDILATRPAPTAEPPQ